MCNRCENGEVVSAENFNEADVYIEDRQLVFDNSDGERSSGMVTIKFCPWCGREL